MDCPICLNAMTEADCLHPLQCKSPNCEYNFCMHCIENLITASKDDFQESSDGNMHVKVHLNCPSCRSDLSGTIRDTLLLRKADFLVSHHGMQCQEFWTLSQKRLKSVLHHDCVKDAIAKAREYEKEFLQTHDRCIAEHWSSSIDQSDTLSTVTESEGDYSKENYDLFPIHDRIFSFDDESSDDEDDECGFEMDLIRGVHKSFRVPKDERLVQKNAKVREDMIDKTLLRSLAPVMTKPEQKRATQLMVSGDILKLVEAAKMLRRIEHNNTRGVKRSQLVKRSSIFRLIDECEQAHKTPTIENEWLSRPSNLRSRIPPAVPKPNTIVARKQSCVRNLENAEFLQSHPLPVRMPKYVEFEFSDLAGPCQFGPVDSGSLFPASLVDDVWDGTVRDAYTRTTIVPLTGTIVRHAPPINHQGVLNVLGEGLLHEDLGIGRFDVPKSRVIAHSIRGGSSAGKQGILPGDVVTHLNGKEIHGTARELMQAIKESIAANAQNEFGECCVSLVLNADTAVAEALRRRGNVACLYT